MAESTGNIRYTFHKSERLCSRKEIDRLFDAGSSLSVYPLKLVFIRRDAFPDIPAQTMFVVPKRSFKKANDRNLLKRRMRESFRLHKLELYAELQQKELRLSIAILFTGKSEENYETIERSVREILVKLCNKI